MNESLDMTTAAYLAGYFERGGSLTAYIRKQKDAPSLANGMVPIESAGIYVRVRDQDPAVPRLLAANFKGKLTSVGTWSWQAWNEEAAHLLTTIQPYFRTGIRRALTKLLLEFHSFIERKREEWPTSRNLTLTAEDLKEIYLYREAIKSLQSGFKPNVIMSTSKD